MPAGTETLEYFNILLDTHEGILAERVPVETCFMTGRDYESFSNFGEYARLYGEEMPPMTRFAPLLPLAVERTSRRCCVLEGRASSG